MPPIECSILPYYRLGSISITAYPDTNYDFNNVEIEILKRRFFGGLKMIYKKQWNMSELKRLVRSQPLQDIFPELAQHLTENELQRLNADKNTLLELLNDPWHRQVHAKKFFKEP
ncbi:MAG: hypothetical protein HYT16_01685 [DPANN group archaeon]|nr:hypothetical protein [DPANN group archaeon]